MKKLSKEAAELLLTISNNEELQAFAKELYPELSKKQLPKSWNELQEIEGYYVGINCNTFGFFGGDTDKDNRNIYATKEQAEASIAMAQLSQLMKVYNYGWEADYLDEESVKYGIGYFGEKLKVGTVYSTRYFLVFKDEETAELFLENFTELIETAKPLL
jgi:hypothetical protein